MPYHRKDLSKEMILQAQHNTRSNGAASRYLNVSYQHYKKWANLYDSDEKVDPTNPDSPFKSLFEKHKNLGGKGIPKFMGGTMNAKKFPIWDIIEGRANSDSYSPNTMKEAMIHEGILREMCTECGFSERRVIDFRMPLLLHFKDNNKRNYRPENCVLICYNCYFLRIGDVFNPKQELAIQDHKSVFKDKDNVDWQLDNYQLEQLEQIVKLANVVPKPSNDLGDDLISRL